jgi:hypothetical protein
MGKIAKTKARDNSKAQRRKKQLANNQKGAIRRDNEIHSLREKVRRSHNKAAHQMSKGCRDYCTMLTDPTYAAEPVVLDDIHLPQLRSAQYCVLQACKSVTTSSSGNKCYLSFSADNGPYSDRKCFTFTDNLYLGAAFPVAGDPSAGIDNKTWALSPYAAAGADEGDLMFAPVSLRVTVTPTTPVLNRGGWAVVHLPQSERAAEEVYSSTTGGIVDYRQSRLRENTEPFDAVAINPREMVGKQYRLSATTKTWFNSSSANNPWINIAIVGAAATDTFIVQATVCYIVWGKKVLGGGEPVRYPDLWRCAMEAFNGPRHSRSIQSEQIDKDRKRESGTFMSLVKSAAEHAPKMIELASLLL